MSAPGAVTLFALLALAMAAAITNFTNSYFRGAYFIYCALGIATAILTIFTLPVMYVFCLSEPRNHH